jgi:pentose-5-phosphate-3-epimerase
MDGSFVQNFTLGTDFVKAIKKGNDDGKPTTIEDIRAEDTVFRAENK